MAVSYGKLKENCEQLRKSKYLLKLENNRLKTKITNLEKEKEENINWLLSKEKVYRLNMQGHSMKIVQEIIAQFKGDMRR
jgi:hypothetical protein